ncbi:MAG: hypothetical protein RLY86_860 [Pseudomonadota bacterium]|jgi:hypothetical protein
MFQHHEILALSPLPPDVSGPIIAAAETYRGIAPLEAVAALAACEAVARGMAPDAGPTLVRSVIEVPGPLPISAPAVTVALNADRQPVAWGTYGALIRAAHPGHTIMNLDLLDLRGRLAVARPDLAADLALTGIAAVMARALHDLTLSPEISE